METPQVDYAKFVARLTKPGSDIKAQMTEEQANLVHLAMLLATEASEFQDAIKKHAIYQKPLDMANVIEELGDIEFALQALRNSLRLGRGDIIDANHSKLSRRYPSGSYSNQDAIARADKECCGGSCQQATD